jgi:hypothetical protein
MRPDDPILKQRPVTAAQRLGSESRVLLLALKDVLRALDGEGPVLLVVPCDVPEIVPPLLRAARDNDAALGLMPSGPLGDARARHRFFETIREAAETVGTSRPIVLLSDVVQVRTDDPEPAAEQVHALVDAGFTGVILDASGLDPDAAPAALSRAAAPALERELGVQVLVPTGHTEEGGRLVGGLKLLGAEPDLVGVVGGDGRELAALASEVDPVGIAWFEGEAAGFAEGLRHALGAGARLLCVHGLLSRVALASLPADLKGALSEVQLRDPAAALAALGDRLGDLDDDARDRMEVRLYAEAEDLIGLLRLKGSGRRIRDRLSG